MSLLFVFVCSVALSGCPQDSGSGTPGAGSAGPRAQAPPVEPDDPAAVAALDKLAASLTRDNGFVVEVNFRDTEIDDSALEYLTGLRHVSSVLLNNTAITDAGLASIGKLDRIQGSD